MRLSCLHSMCDPIIILASKFSKVYACLHRTSNLNIADSAKFGFSFTTDVSISQVEAIPLCKKKQGIFVIRSRFF